MDTTQTYQPAGCDEMRKEFNEQSEAWAFVKKLVGAAFTIFPAFLVPFIFKVWNEREMTKAYVRQAVALEESAQMSRVVMAQIVTSGSLEKLLSGYSEVERESVRNRIMAGDQVCMATHFSGNGTVVVPLPCPK